MAVSVRSGFDGKQSSVSRSDNANSKGGTTSSGGNELSDNYSNASDSDDLRVSVKIDSTLFKQTKLRASEKMEQAGNNTIGSIAHCINSSAKNMSYGVVVWGGPERVWYLSPNFIATHCTTLYQITFPKEKKPLFPFYH